MHSLRASGRRTDGLQDGRALNQCENSGRNTKRKTRKSRRSRNTSYETADMHKEYFDRVDELGKQKGYKKTINCPQCGRLLWTNGKVEAAQLA